MDNDLDYIKRQYCAYKCPVKDIQLEDINCSSCDLCGICDKLDIKCAKKVEGKSACEVCQWDNIIKELRDFNMLKEK
jgi:hypothetical protein